MNRICYFRYKLRKGGVFSFVLLTLATGVSAAGKHIEYQEILRSYQVALHCGLATEDVAAGFRVAIQELHATRAISGEEAQIHRATVAEAIRQDWRNRGMGHRDPRCLTQGRDAAKRLRRVIFESR